MRRISKILGVITISVILIAGVQTAFAHGGGDDPKDALALVQQAIAAIQNKDMDLATDKVNDAIESDDPAGVKMDLVKQAQGLLATDMDKALSLLQQSLAAPTASPTTVQAEPTIPLKPNFQGTKTEDGLLIAAALLMLAGGLIVSRA